MSVIPNPTPQTPTIFDKMWVASVNIIMPDLVFTSALFPQSKGRLMTNILPYDGTHLLYVGGKMVTIADLVAKRTSDSTFDAILTSLTAECQRQAGNTKTIKTVLVSAPDPTKPVRAMVQFTDGTSYQITDCFALCATDSIFATVFTNTMGELAILAGLTIV